MGLRRRHKKINNKNPKFDPKKVVKLDHHRKCYVVDEAPRYPLIATPRQLQKRFHYFSESETESDEANSKCGSDDELLHDESLAPEKYISKDLIRMSSCSNDSGFEGGGTAPVNPKKWLGNNCSK